MLPAEWRPLVLLGRLGALDLRSRLVRHDVAGGYARAADLLDLARRMVYEPGGAPVSIKAGVEIENAALQALERSPLPHEPGFKGRLARLAGLKRPPQDFLIAERDAGLRRLHTGVASADLDNLIDLLAINTDGVIRAVYDHRIALAAAGRLTTLAREEDRWFAEHGQGPAGWFGWRRHAVALFHPYQGIPYELMERLDPPHDLLAGPLAAEARFEALRRKL